LVGRSIVIKVINIVNLYWVPFLGFVHHVLLLQDGRITKLRWLPPEIYGVIKVSDVVVDPYFANISRVTTYPCPKASSGTCPVDPITWRNMGGSSPTQFVSIFRHKDHKREDPSLTQFLSIFRDKGHKREDPRKVRSPPISYQRKFHTLPIQVCSSMPKKVIFMKGYKMHDVMYIWG
jgi:hypothetical protein